jgi:cobalt-zinc-cadmium resistance protein CzcA
LIVDGAVIIVENALRRLAERQEHEGRLLTREERMEETTLAAKEMVRPTVYGQLIIFLVFRCSPSRALRARRSRRWRSR